MGASCTFLGVWPLTYSSLLGGASPRGEAWGTSVLGQGRWHHRTGFSALSLLLGNSVPHVVFCRGEETVRNVLETSGRTEVAGEGPAGPVPAAGPGLSPLLFTFFKITKRIVLR